MAKAERVAQKTGVIGNGGGLVMSEESIPPLPKGYRVEALGVDHLPSDPISGFWLDSTQPSTSEPEVKRAKAILWLAGGGYVTGYPLNDRPIFSLARTLPSQYRIMAPSISRALSLERSFPVPLLDALAAYAHLRSIGYAAEDINVIGNSAGGGLAWSLLSYLVALDGANIGSLGVPRAVAMISPWLKLPPAQAGTYPDFVNTPQLFNAAKNYLARYPAPSNLHSLSTPKEPTSHLDWLDESIFSRLSAHHPLISPSADRSSPFVQKTLELLASRGTKITIHCGTAEWFYGPIVDLASAAEKAGVGVDLIKNEGGLHSEACLSWPERGGPAAILQRSILACLECEK